MKEHWKPNNGTIEDFCAIARMYAEEFLRECKACNFAPTYAYFTLWLHKKSGVLGIEM